MTRASRRKSKPSAPRRIEAAETEGAAQELAEARREAARLKSVGCEARVAHERQEDGSMKWVARGDRRDVFSLLLSRKALDQGAHEAFRAHELDLHMAEGAGNPDRRPDHIRASVEGAPGQITAASVLDAAERVRETAKQLSRRDSALLAALMDGNAALAPNWRGVVQKQTGETGDEAQAACIRALGENLIWARAQAIAKIKASRHANDDVASHPRIPAPQPVHWRPVTWFRGQDCG